MLDGQKNQEIPNHLKNKIFAGDSLEILKQLPENSVDLLFTNHHIVLVWSMKIMMIHISGIIILTKYLVFLMNV